MVDQSSLKFLGAERNFSILHAHICISEVRYQGQIVLSKVGFANYPIASLFNQVDVILGGKLIASATNTYAHHSILEVLLNYDRGCRVTVSCRLFCEDTAGQMEEMDISADPVLNTGLKRETSGNKRARLSSYSV